MKYKYHLMLVHPGKSLTETAALVETELRKWGEAGWRLYSRTFINDQIGTNMNGQPKFETVTELLFEKVVTEA